MAWPEWVHRTTQVSHLLTVTNSSINFYIYVAKQVARYSIYNSTSTVVSLQTPVDCDECTIVCEGVYSIKSSRQLLYLHTSLQLVSTPYIRPS